MSAANIPGYVIFEFRGTQPEIPILRGNPVGCVIADEEYRVARICADFDCRFANPSFEVSHSVGRFEACRPVIRILPYAGNL